MKAEDRLHFGFLGEPFLFANLRIDSFGSFIAAALFVALVCFSERILTLALSRRWNPLPILRRTQLRIALWRSALYWVVTMQRMLYMLAAMSLNLGILVVIVTSLAIGQFVMEITENPGTVVGRNRSESGTLLPRHSQDVHGVNKPLLATSADDYELDSTLPYRQEEHRYPSSQTNIFFSSSPTNSHPHLASPSQTSHSFQYIPTPVSEQTILSTTRPRSRSKPDGIFIHPTQSNFVRAEVMAIRMGFGTDKNEYVDPSSYPRSPSQNSDTAAPDSPRGWGTGNGRDIARGLLGVSSFIANAGL